MKKYILLSLSIVLVGFTSYLLYNVIKTKQQNNSINIRKQTLPNFTFYNLDSIATNSKFLSKNKPVCIFYFNADCEHCQYEAREINKKIALFKDAQLVMVSFNTINEILQFQKQYQLYYPNITFLQDPKLTFKNWFGKTSVPAVFIYNAQHKLIKEYHGETKIEAIVKGLFP